MSSFTETDLVFRQTVRDFARAEIGQATFKAEWDGMFSAEVSSKLNALGLMGILVPSEFGGASAELRKLIIAIEELSTFSASAGSQVAFHNLACDVISASKKSKIRETLLPKLASGILGTIALDSKPKIIYEKARIGATLNGWSDYVLGSSQAGVILLVTKIADSDSMTILSLSKDQLSDSKSFEESQQSKYLGLRASASSKISFKNLKIPDDSVLFNESETHSTLGGIITESRLLISAIALGIAQASLNALVEYSRKKLSSAPFSRGSVEDIVSQAAVSLETSRCLCYSIVDMTKDERAKARKESAIARVSATTCAISNASQLIRISRGQDPNADRYMRDATSLQNWIESEDSLRELIAMNTSAK